MSLLLPWFILFLPLDAFLFFFLFPVSPIGFSESLISVLFMIIETFFVEHPLWVAYYA